MAAPKGNEFWKKRSSHGRKRIFATPEIMREAIDEYFEYQSTQAWNRVDYKGKEVEKVLIPTASPFTLTGLCLFLGVNTKYFAQFESELDLETEEGKDFSNVITYAREVIYTQKFEGAATGAYNANIIARDLGLADKTKSEHTGEVKVSNKYEKASEEDLEKALIQIEKLKGDIK